MRFENFTNKLMLTLGTIKCALVAAFFISFGFINPNAALAQAGATCDGINLVETLKAERPEAYAKILAEAAQIPNGNANYWKVEREGYPVSYLFGTMHMADPKIATIAENVKSAINGSDRLVIETLDILNPAAAQSAMAKLGHLTLLADGTLRDLIRDDLEDELEVSLSKRGLPIAIADRMQPWLIATMVSLPICEIQRKQTGEKVLDAALAEYATQQEKEIAGLETMAEQLTAMASLPQDYHVSALEETLSNGALAEDMIETLKALYLEGNMGLVLPLMKEVSPASFAGEGAAQFQEALIKKRNELMFERVLPMLKTGKTFVAVGALHLPGEMGLVELLKQEGFDLTPVQ